MLQGHPSSSFLLFGNRLLGGFEGHRPPIVRQKPYVWPPWELTAKGSPYEKRSPMKKGTIVSPGAAQTWWRLTALPFELYSRKPSKRTSAETCIASCFACSLKCLKGLAALVP